MRVVEVDAAQEGVAAGGDHLVDVVVELEHRGVEGAAAQVVDEHPLVELPARSRRPAPRRWARSGSARRGARQPPGLAHRLALVVVVVGGHGDHRARDRLAELVLRDLPAPRGGSAPRSAAASRPVAELHRRLAALAGRDLVVEPVLDLPDDRRLEGAADQPLGAVHRLPRVGEHLPLRRVADHQLAARVERDDRGDGVVALAAESSTAGLPSCTNAGARVGGAQVDADDRARCASAPRSGCSNGGADDLGRRGRHRRAPTRGASEGAPFGCGAAGFGAGRAPRPGRGRVLGGAHARRQRRRRCSARGAAPATAESRKRLALAGRG